MPLQQETDLTELLEFAFSTVISDHPSANMKERNTNHKIWLIGVFCYIVIPDRIQYLKLWIPIS